MMEMPEAMTIARQINQTIRGKHILKVTAGYTPHKFAWYHGDPQGYGELLEDKRVDEARALGGMVEIKAGDVSILLSDGAAPRYHGQNESRPKKHQLLMEFDDSSAMSATVQMYGGMQCFHPEGFENVYYTVAQEKPSPLTEEFNADYFDELISSSSVQKLSAKAFLATEQRIPGLGNGVLQDVLWYAKIHPKKKISTLSAEQKHNLFRSVKTIIADMTENGGRDTEKDLFGCNGGYITRLSKNTVGSACPVCGGVIINETYMGGSIYHCEGCQVQG
jgi:formamidopyrimidine-DNA glycosylase